MATKIIATFIYGEAFSFQGLLTEIFKKNDTDLQNLNVIYLHFDAPT